MPSSWRRQETAQERFDRELSESLGTFPDPLLDKGRDAMGDAMLKANPRLRKPAKVIGKGKDLYDAVTNPYGYLRDEAIEKGAEYIWKNPPVLRQPGSPRA